MSTPDQELVLTHFIVSDDVERSRRFYADVLGGHRQKQARRWPEARRMLGTISGRAD